jgi:hypothetical protein
LLGASTRPVHARQAGIQAALDTGAPVTSLLTLLCIAWVH